MLAFKIEVDGEHLALAGFEDWSVLGAHLAATQNRMRAEGHCELSVGGLSKRDESGVAYHVRWPGRTLRIGSVVTVSLVETDQPDAPRKRYRSDSKIQESPYTDEELKDLRRQDYLELRKEFGENVG